MSKTVDERVVSMQFDNKNFEENVQTTMSTLDKFKEKLNLDGAAKGLEEVDKAANSVDMSGLGNAVESVKVKFSALEVAGITAITNITNSLMNFAKSTISSLTIDPIYSGWDKYAEKTSAVQTIMAATAKDFKDTATQMEYVNEQLDKLNWFTDETSYSFNDMVSNIGKFTSNNVKLDTAVTAMQGISTWAAQSGANVNQASNAMYNLAQAISVGSVKLIDWKSIENANMATTEFKQTVLDTAVAVGTLTKSTKKSGLYLTKNGSKEVSVENFSENLSKGWFSSDVLLKALDKYGAFTNKLYDAYNKINENADMTTSELLSNLDDYKSGSLDIQAMSEETGMSVKDLKSMMDELTSSTMDLGKKSFKAAQEAKTFQEALDSAVDAVSTGWMNTFEIIFGDYEEAKKLWTDLANALWDIFASSGERRNLILEKALNSTPFGSLQKKIESVTGATNAMTAATLDYNSVVKKVISGNYGNGQSRWDKLTNEGYNWAKVQNKVNEKLGNSVRHNEKLGKEQKKVNSTQKVTIKQLTEMSDEQLKALDFTDKEIEGLKQLKEQSELTGISVESLAKDLTQLTGKSLISKAFSNVYGTVTKILDSITTAWQKAFPPLSSDSLYNMIAGLHKLSTYLVITQEQADKLTDVFSGVFAILDLVVDVVKGGLRLGIGLVTTVLSKFNKAMDKSNTSLLDMSAKVGNTVSGFRDWVEQNEIINKVVDTLVDLFSKLLDAIGEFVEYIWNLDETQAAISAIGDAFNYVGDAIKTNFGKGISKFTDFVESISKMDKISFKGIADGLYNMKNSIFTDFLGMDATTKNLGLNVIQGLMKGINGGASTVVSGVSGIVNLLINTVKFLLGIHSPSTVFAEIGGNVVAGLCNGITSGFDAVGQVGQTLFSSLTKMFSGVDFTDVFLVGTVSGAGYMINKLTNILDRVTKPLDGFNKVLSSFAQVGKSYAKYWDTKTTNLRAESLYTFAKAILVVAASIYIVSTIKTEDLAKSVGAIGLIMAAMIALSKASVGIDSVVDFAKIGAFAIGLGAAMLLIAAAIKKVASIEDPDRASASFFQMTIMLGVMGGLAIALSKFGQFESAVDYGKIGAMILSMSAAVLLIAVAIKMISGIDEADVQKANASIIQIGLMFMAFQVLSKFTGVWSDSAGKMILEMSAGMILIAAAMKIIAGIDQTNVDKALSVIRSISLIFDAFIVLSQFSGESASKAGSMVLKMSAAMAILAVAMKIIATMSGSEISQGLYVMYAIGALFSVFIFITMEYGGQAEKAGNMLLRISAAMAILAIAMKIIGTMTVGEVAKGIVVIGLIGILFAAIIEISNYAGKNAAKAGTMLLRMSVAIAVLAIATKIIGRLSLEDVTKGIIFMTGIAAFMAIMVSVTKYAGKHADKAGDMLMKMSVAILILVAAVAVLSFLDPEKVAIGTACVSALLVFFAILVKCCENVNTKINVNIIILGVIIAAFAGIIYALSSLPVQNVLGVATALSELILSLGICLNLLNGFTGIGTQGLIAVGTMTLVVAALAGILYLLKDMPSEGLLDKAMSISLLLATLTASLAVLTEVGMFASSAQSGMLVLAEFIGGLTVVFVALGALMEYVPALEQFLDKGISVLEKVANGLGSIVGNIVSGFMSGATKDLPALGTTLSEFMNNAGDFFDKANKIDADAMTGIKNLAEAMLIITGTEFLNSLTSFTSGTSEVDKFGSQLESLGSGLGKFKEGLGDLTEDDITQIKLSAEAVKALAEVADAIPNTGGIAGAIAGENDIDDFGKMLSSLAVSMIIYSIIVKNVDTDAINNSLPAINSLVEMSKTIPNTKGLISFITGQKDLDKFGEQLVQLANSLVSYGKIIGGDDGLTEQDIKNIVTSSKAIGALAKVTQEVPDSKGFFGWFTGGTDIAGFGRSLISLGSGLNQYAGSVADADFTNVKSSTDALSSIAKVLNSMSKIDTSGVTSVVSSFNSLSNMNVDGFISNFKGKTQDMMSVGTSLANGLKSGLTGSSEALSKAVSSLVSKASKSITSSTNKGAFKKGGQTLVSDLSKGMTDKVSSLTTSITTLLGKIKTAINSYYSTIKGTGRYLVEGFAKGISENTYLSTAKARAMAQAAVNAANDALHIDSPSKVLAQTGRWAGMGFANGLSEYISVAYDTGANMADSATSGISKAISSISDAMDADIDSEPTIRPVLDLTNLRSGASSINSMFNSNPTLALAGEVGSIDAMMSNRIQNSDNSDVVSAINELKSAVLDSAGDTNIINGITYDDGSNITSSIKSLIRAAKIERRK